MVWINKSDVNMKILLPKRYFTLRSAFGSYHYQKEPEHNIKATEVPIFTEGHLFEDGLGLFDLEGRRYWGIEIMSGTEKVDPWHLPNSTLISRRSVKWNGNNIKTEKVLYIVFMHILLVKLTTNKILLRQQAW